MNHGATPLAWHDCLVLGFNPQPVTRNRHQVRDKISDDIMTFMTWYKNSSIYSLWTRYKLVPLYWKVIPILILLAAIFLLDQGWISSSISSEILHRLYYLPIILSGLLFGFKGGFLSAVVVSFLFIPHWLEWRHIPIPHIGHFDELILFYAFGILIGLLVDRERMETQLRQDQEYLALLGEAAATVAHELKNPVITIGAYVQKLLKKTSPEDPNLERLLVIHKECQRIEILLKDMIHFSRPITLNCSSVNINHLVNEVLKTVHPQAEQRKVLVSSTIDEDLPSILADQGRLFQVLHNPILNAVQASAQEQTVQVRTQRQKGQIIIEVADLGCGISKDCQDRVFSPFYSTKKEGSGLGLAISKRIIESHQGRLDFRANLPTGTIFFISLPLSRKIPQARSGAKGQKIVHF
jgi:two-component system sensor histidine kinase HydH